MRFLGTLLLFVGYTLVYAAVAGGGKFATEPWMGLMTDAYSVPTGGAPIQGSAGFAPPVRPRTSPINFPIF